MAQQRTYLCIDLKSFYASVECVERKLNPMTTNLVVADESRTEKTICLAVSPSLKTYGIPGRARLFEVVQKVREANARRQYRAPHRKLTGESYDDNALHAAPELAIGYIIAKPRMALYMEYSTRIYSIYLRFVAPEDIHVYSIDEVFMDITDYMGTYRLSARELAQKMIHEVFHETGITATAGIGTNLYLAKIAMDIVAKHAQPDANGVRMAELDEMSYRQQLWSHRPLTDFWRIGYGYAKKLEESGMYTMGEIALRSIQYEDSLYNMFGINAELLIDHAWGFEPCTMQAIKAYKPSTNSISSGQVLQCPYDFAKARLIVHEMTEMLVLDLVGKRLVTDQFELTVGYDIESLTDPKIRSKYKGPVTTDHYGRKMPKAAHGSINLGRQTSSGKIIVNAALELFDRIVNPDLLVRRMYVVANHVVDESSVSTTPQTEQLDLFTDYEMLERKRQQEDAELMRERKRQEAILALQKRYGKNAVLKGISLQEGATTKDRNAQIGGHRA